MDSICYSSTFWAFRLCSGNRASICIMKGVSFDMDCVSSSGILLLCCFGDLAQIVCFQGIPLYDLKYSLPICTSCMGRKHQLAKQYMLTLLFMGSTGQPSHKLRTNERSSTGNIRVLRVDVSLLRASLYKPLHLRNIEELGPLHRNKAPSSHYWLYFS